MTAPATRSSLRPAWWRDALILRDPAYLVHLRSQPCIITGMYGDDHHSVVAAHIGTAGTGIKSPDNWAVPLAHDLHMLAHQKGEISMFREHMPDDLLREAVRLLAEQRYSRYLEGPQ